MISPFVDVVSQFIPSCIPNFSNSDIPSILLDDVTTKSSNTRLWLIPRSAAAVNAAAASRDYKAKTILPCYAKNGAVNQHPWLMFVGIVCRGFHQQHGDIIAQSWGFY